MRTDEQIMNDIEEYRTLRTICGCFYSGNFLQMQGAVGQPLVERMKFLDQSTWPDRMERFKDFNDVRLWLTYFRF